MFLRFITVFVLMVTSTMLLADSCSDWTQAAYRAYSDKDKRKLQTLYNKIKDSRCLAMDQHYVRLNLSRVLYEKMQEADAKGKSRIDGLEAILKIEPTFWPALLDLGNHHDAQKEFDAAHEYYNRGLAAINDTNATPDDFVPDRIEILNTYAKADNSLLATEGYLPLFSGRGTYKTRGVNPIGRNIPIHFCFGCNTLKGQDKKYAKALYKALVRQGSPNITLIGHTDPVGLPDNNLKLSKQRAKIVKQYLKRKGYSGTVTSTGRGEDRPLKSQYSNPLKHYGEKRWHRMLRRVEIRTH